MMFIFNSNPNQSKVRVTVVDARMGRGKSSAAIRYMNENKDTKRFLYITPFLDEVDRICEQCEFNQSNSNYSSKSKELKRLIKKGKNISATHALFYLMDKETLELISDMHYSLIVDESLQLVSSINIAHSDMKSIVEYYAETDEHGFLTWKNKDYTGVFDNVKKIADSHSLIHLDSALIKIVNPDIFNSFDEVFMLTYLFEGQYQRAYLDCFGFKYHVVGIEHDEYGYRFSDRPDRPPAVDYYRLINIKGGCNNNWNKVGDNKWALSKSWFDRRGRGNKDVKKLRNSMRNFFQGIPDGNSESRLWTTFKNDREKLIGPNKRYNNNFLQISARATNEFRDCTDLAYIANRFDDPNLKKFFSQRGVKIDSDKFALSEMLQWIWRGAIRDDKPINLYIPSRRMRDLLTNWMDEMKQEV